MKFKYFLSFLVFCLGIACFMGCPAKTYAQSADDVNKRIEELQRKISDLQTQENNLTNTIKSLDSQINLKQLEIKAKQASIDKLNVEINALNDEIGRLEGNIQIYIEDLQKRIPVSYKRLLISRFPLMFLGKDFNQLVNNYKYDQLVQRENADVLKLIIRTQQHYSGQKDTRELKKEQQTQLKKQLEADNIILANTKSQKKMILDQTKSSEIVFQQLLAQALAEKNAIDNALITGVSMGPIKKGDPIALVGNTGYPGCSTGAHLHFEIRKNNSWVDPSQYLSNKTVTDDQNGGTWTVGSGDWNWPLSDTIRVTQHFGKTPYSWRYAYSGGIHTGFDMVSGASEVIRAPKDGTLYSSSQACGSSSIIKIKYIDHGDGIISFFLHVQ